MPNIICNKSLLVMKKIVMDAALFTLILTTLVTTNQAGIIDTILHHKFRQSSSPTTTGSNNSLMGSLDPMNASSSSILEHFEGHNGQTTTVEYQSPLEKIIEIISGKPRSIFVMDQHKSMEPDTAQSSLPSELTSNDMASLNMDQNWAIIGPAERYIPQSHGSSVIPQASQTLEHIEQLRPNVREQPHFQQIYTSQNLNELERQILERAASVQNQAPNAQPILLGSYVPQQLGVPRQAIHAPILIPSPVIQRPFTVAPTVLFSPALATTTAPESDQESEQESQKESGEDSNENEASDDKTEEHKSEPKRAESSSDRVEASERDEDKETAHEESKSGGSRAEPEDESDEEPNSNLSNQGSSNYHESYDSDTMDEPSSSASVSEADNSDNQPEAESSNNIITGLINVGLNDDCLQCICRASSGCDYLLRCITRGANEKYCGPFQITEEYWKKAGSPGDSPNNFSAFDECANEADCAVETVTNYMKRFHRDCDGDGNITCLDYARLHRLKPDECDNTEKLANNNYEAYWAKFQRCAEGYNRSRTRQDEEDM